MTEVTLSMTDALAPLYHASLSISEWAMEERRLLENYPNTCYAEVGCLLASQPSSSLIANLSFQACRADKSVLSLTQF